MASLCGGVIKKQSSLRRAHSHLPASPSAPLLFRARPSPQPSAPLQLVLFEAPALARAIYGTTEIDHEIPRGLYVAVAQVLSYIFQLKSLTPHRAARLRRPTPEVGEEFAKYVADPDDEAMRT